MGQAQELDSLRVDTVRNLSLLDTPSEENFARYTRLASRALEVPIACVSLIDAEQQWHTSMSGFQVDQLPRMSALCQVALQDDGTLLLPDLTLDARFAQHPMVQGAPHLRFYAGHPLILPSGERVGVLCVLDYHPRQLDARGTALLSDLAACIVSELVCRAQAAAHARERAMLASQAEIRLLRVISHEVRTPLSAVIGFSEMLLEDFQAAGHEQYVPDIRRVETAGRILLEQINALLDLRQLDAENLKWVGGAVDVEALAGEVLAMAQPLAAQNGTSLTVSCRSKVPLVWTDGPKLRQVLVNLVRNAAQVTRSGTIELGIGVVHGPDGQQLKLAVRDTGVGMLPEVVGGLFPAHPQAAGRGTSRCAGAGIGLTLSRKLALLLGGDLVAESLYGKGSTFTLTLPLHEVPAAGGADAR